MVSRLPGELLVDGSNGPSRWLQAEIECFGQRGQPLAQAKRLGQQGRLMPGMQILHVGPARYGGIVRQ